MVRSNTRAFHCFDQPLLGTAYFRMFRVGRSRRQPVRSNGCPRPFKAPPPPQPFNEPASTPAKTKKASKPRTSSPRPKRKSWSTTIVVTEYTNPDGERTYSAESTPIVRLPVGSHGPAAEPQPSTQTPMRQPFLERMRIRQQRWQDYRGDRSDKAPWQRQDMQLISVKRQRKLKMKKHKYKKLMRRTRNLRRRLGKL